MYLTVIIIYALVLIGVSAALSHRHQSNADFYTARNSAPWPVVAYGMIGASVSGISLVSVPGMVTSMGWTYLQTCFGFIVGYFLIGCVLLPLYYRLRVTSIYEYIGQRLGTASHRTASGMFVLAKIISAATKLYVAALVLQQFVFERLGVPFAVVVVCCVAVLWIYTRKSGIRTLVWTDMLQTTFLIMSILLIGMETYKMSGLSSRDACDALLAADHTRIFVFDDWHSTQNFFKQFLSGIFIVVVMTGLDQDMMQKNLACKTLKQSRTGMFCYGLMFAPLNAILLLIGSLIIISINMLGLNVDTTMPDAILPAFTSAYLSPFAGICLVLGIVAASFSSADSALISITTIITVDIFKNAGTERGRRVAHLVVCVVFALIVTAFSMLAERSIIDAIYIIVGYAYGPLLGMFAYGLFTRLQVHDKYVPYIAIASPVVCYMLKALVAQMLNYTFGYELLLINGLLTFIGLLIITKRK